MYNLHTEPSSKTSAKAIAAARCPGGYIVASVAGLAIVEIDDRFDELLHDLHWEAIAKWFVDHQRDDLVEFAGFEIGGLRLVSDPVELVGCDWWVQR